VTTESASPEQQLSACIAKFEPHNASLIRQCRAELRKLLPTAFELVYDNYNFFVIGYSSSERPSDCIVSIAASANGVGLSFYRGASVADPSHLLQGSGKQNRFIRIPAIETLHDAGVVALIGTAAAHGKAAPSTSGGGETIIRSVSAKQRPRRR
jgi:hypothetical protein